jgi:hypothetical protein
MVEEFSPLNSMNKNLDNKEESTHKRAKDRKTKQKGNRIGYSLQLQPASAPLGKGETKASTPSALPSFYLLYLPLLFKILLTSLSSPCLSPILLNFQYLYL